MSIVFLLFINERVYYYQKKKKIIAQLYVPSSKKGVWPIDGDEMFYLPH